ncbi:MAG TPA: FecR family protein, partial [Micavibrio sp.]
MIMRLLFVILFAILLPVSAQAQAPLNSAPLPNTAEINAEKIAIGTLIATEGSVTRLDSTGEALPLTAKAPLHLHDVIETGEDARALIVLIDNSEFTLGENAQFTIDEYIFDDQNDALNRGRYSVLRGAFLYVSGLIAKKADPRHDPDVIVNTPAASIGIRGTAFWGGEIDGAYGVLVTDGQVNVQTQRGRINVDKDTGTTIISKNDTPARATAWDAEKINRAVATITMKNPEDARARITENAPTQAAQLAAYKEYLIKHYEQQKLLKDNRTPSTRIDNRAQPATKEEATTAKTPPASVPT